MGTSDTIIVYAFVLMTYLNLRGSIVLIISS